MRDAGTRSSRLVETAPRMLACLSGYRHRRPTVGQALSRPASDRDRAPAAPRWSGRCCGPRSPSSRPPSTWSTVLDIGGGTGGFAVPLAELGYRRDRHRPEPGRARRAGARAAETGTATASSGVQGDANDVVDVARCRDRSTRWCVTASSRSSMIRADALRADRRGLASRRNRQRAGRQPGRRGVGPGRRGRLADARAAAGSDPHGTAGADRPVAAALHRWPSSRR